MYSVTGASVNFQPDYLERTNNIPYLNSWCNYRGNSQNQAEKIFNEELDAAIKSGWTVVHEIAYDWLVEARLQSPDLRRYAVLTLRKD